MRAKLTVILPVKNERSNIQPCIEAVREIADEIIVADSGSTDETLQIVQRLGGCRIIEREYINSGDFKNWAIPQASHPWVLIVDADERVTPELSAEIQELLQTGPRQDGYWIYRANYFMGHRVRYGGWRNDCCLRLFQRDLGRYSGPSDHGEVGVSTGKVGRLKTRMTHYTCRHYDHYFLKFQRYTTLQAQQWFEQGRQPSYWRLLLHAPLRFLRDYILLLGILDGMAGLQLAMMAGFYSFMKQARLWQLHCGQEQSDPPVPLSQETENREEGAYTIKISEHSAKRAAA